MSESSDHPPKSPDDAPHNPPRADENLGSTGPLVSFEPDGADAPASAAGSQVPPASDEGEPARRGGSRLFPHLPDDPRIAQDAAVPSDDLDQAGQDQAGYEPLFDAPAEATQPETLPQMPTSETAVPQTAVPQTAVPQTAVSQSGATDASEAGAATVTAPPVETAAPSAEPDRFAEWARLDASASHWREASQDYEERGVVSDEARTVLHTDTPTAAQNGRNLPAAVVVGIVLAALFFGALRLGEAATVGLITVVLVLAAAEFYRSARPLGYRPATLVGLVGVGGLVVGVHLRGVEAYPIVLATAAVTIFCWFLLGIERDHPTANLSITALGLVWIGGLGSFAALMLREPNGDALLIAAVIGTVVYDIGGYVVGRTTGQSRLAPRISPNKTHEGLIGGIVLSVVVTTLVMNRFPGVYPWTESLIDVLWLSVAVALAAPLGDLSQSLVKRDVNVKDMGNLLPGHGGVFDRFDALMFALPAAFFVGTNVSPVSL